MNPTPTEETALDELPAQSHGIEREVFGKWTILLRNFGGIIAVLVVCGMGIFNSYTIYLSVKDHHVWPSETSMFIMVVGPVLCCWSWMQVNNTLTTIFNGGSNLTKIRSKLASVIEPAPKNTDGN